MRYTNNRLTRSQRRGSRYRAPHVILNRVDIPSELPRFEHEHEHRPPRRTVLVLVIDCLIRLASNAIFKALENIRRRDIYRFGLGDAFRVRVPLR